MSNKHTAGQWRYDAKYKSICTGERYDHYCEIAIAGLNANMGDESKANAKLIAAAPTLLNAAILCESITDKCNNAMLPKHIQELLQSINETLNAAIKAATL